MIPGASKAISRGIGPHGFHLWLLDLWGGSLPGQGRNYSQDRPRPRTCPSGSILVTIVTK